VLYRRRAENAGFKAGNLMDFLDRHAAGFDHALVLDADSAMSAEAVARLVRVMQADPGMAILQSAIAGRGAETRFSRLYGFGLRHGARVWSTGQAWWQGPEQLWWGHNALVRIAAFRRDARLPPLPGGGPILSHDYAEAAMLHAAGWAVRVLPEDAGSSERHPPDLPALFGRDLRWAAGNLQYRHLLRRPEFGRLGRLQMLEGHPALRLGAAALRRAPARGAERGDRRRGGHAARRAAPPAAARLRRADPAEAGRLRRALLRPGGPAARRCCAAWRRNWRSACCWRRSRRWSGR
jgi:membrane glycosyltransferase